MPNEGARTLPARKQGLARENGAAPQVSLWTRLRDLSHSLLLTQDYFIPLAALTLLLDAALTLLIIRKVAYTEIDYATYMQQAKLFLKGARNYADIRGDTGPCVYPAGHLYVYSALHWTTAGGQNLRLAQYIFAAIYLLGQAAIIEVYRKSGMPSLLLAFLPLSKRLHSIYVLRLFNDGIAMTGVWIALALVAHRRLSLASVMASLALSVKMNVLLFLPALAVVIYRAKGFVGAAVDGGLIVVIQALLGLPFLVSHPPAVYLSQAFDVSRQFLYKWTVNLRFLPEEIFLDRRLGVLLLLAHAGLLLLFALTRWTGIARQGAVWISQTWRRGDRPVERLTSRDSVLMLLTANLIGILCARSLHYQFYSWYAQSIPFLVWEAHLPLILKIAIPIFIEAAWNVFPATPISSTALCVSNAALLAGLYRRQTLRGARKTRQE
ncbi:unnamed protein product [Parajaminaea phylloscopi]